MEGAIGDRMVTYDFERLMDKANLKSCSEFADEMIKRMWLSLIHQKIMN